MIKKIIVIGGGASGMAAALSAKQWGGDDVQVAILEKNDKLGRKLLATGNGRCNFTNMDCTYEDFLTQKESDQSFQKTVLELFPPDKALNFFARIGVLARIEEEGRVYPYSGQGASVQEAFVRKLDHMGVQICLNQVVKNVEKKDRLFYIDTENPGGKKETVTADAVILAAGGKAGLQFGTVGESYKLANKLGHTVVKPIPALVPVLCQAEGFMGLKGVRSKGCVTLKLDGRTLAVEEGEIQFTEDGLSGICVFNLSRNVQWKDGAFPKGYTMSVDFYPQLSEDQVLELLDHGKKYLGFLNAPEFLKGVLHEKLANAMMAPLKLDHSVRMEDLSEDIMRKMAAILKDWPLSVVGTKSWTEAQVTCGGVSLEEISPQTMESLVVPDLYITGETLDADGKCGGFNLHWAWATGFLAGKAAAKG